MVSQRNARVEPAAWRRGVRVSGTIPSMVALHTGLLAGCLAEVWLRPTDSSPGWAGRCSRWCSLAQALRWWCIATLGRRWNTRVIVVPGLPLVTRGPTAGSAHPNYVAVVAEGIALPLVHTAWITAVAFTVLNAGLLRVRIRVENAALRSATTATPVRRVAQPDGHSHDRRDRRRRRPGRTVTAL